MPLYANSMLHDSVKEISSTDLDFNGDFLTSRRKNGWIKGNHLNGDSEIYPGWAWQQSGVLNKRSMAKQYSKA